MVRCRYEQIAEVLENKIKSGEWAVGQKIPGELELAKAYQVGRSTIRETLNILQQKGIIDKRHGSGTYVKENRQQMDNPILFLSSIGRMIEDAGYKAGSVFYGVVHEKPTQEMQKYLHLDPDEDVVVINRERTANGTPVAFSYNVFPEKTVGTIFDDGLHGSIFQILEEKCRLDIDHAETMLKGINYNRKSEWDMQAARYLNGSIVLMEQLHYDSQGNPLFFSFDYIDTDVMGLHIRRQY